MATKLEFDIVAKDRASDKFDKVGKSADGMGSKLKGFAVVGAAAFAAAGVAAGKFAWSAIGSASDLNETISKSSVIFGKNAKSMETWASGAAKTMGLSKNAALSAATGFGDMFSQIGFSGDQATKMSKQVVQMSADLGSFSNLDTADVADRMSAAFRGEFDSLQAVIPNINAARVESEALAKTGKKTAKELTAQEKAAAVLAIVHKDGARAMGDFSRTSGSLANQQKILSAQFENAKAKLGEKLLPIAVKVAQFLTTHMGPAFQKVGKWVQENLIPPLKEFGERIAPKVRDYMDKVRQAFKDAGPYLDLLGKVVKNVLIPALGWLAEHALAQAGRQVAILGKAFGALGRAGTWLWNNALQPAFKFITQAIAKTIGVLGKLFGVLASIPGAPKWIGRTANALSNASAEVEELAGKITKLDGTTANVGVRYSVTVTGQEALNTLLAGPLVGGAPRKRSASGTTFAPSGGSYLVGELGPERVTLPRGAQVDNAAMTRDSGGMDYTRLARAIVSALREGTPLVQLPDAGRGAYLMGG
ncbi:hypothetical protein GCM10011584_09320 [Nocardioides phosphati]|uniref:Phage tail tape measure protein n=1 Tax=Nocardioides phosphati TaxID=1867775 RepID=A0ABQ2N954_9ACTN|nr:hypothetical protein [Nocardioides phosphati]GGO86604.1 hypothetical protein GCM10011584_09320 [Nocardioides phosphati]